MARLKLTTNTDAVLRRLDALEQRIADVAVPRALNAIRDRVETAGLREIGRVYGVSRNRMAQYLTPRYAKAGELAAGVRVKGIAFSLKDFGPRQSKRGVTVRIKGRSVTIPHAFIGPGGHVFARGAYDGKKLAKTYGSFGRFVFGRRQRVTRPRGRRTELPINKLYTFAPPDALNDDGVRRAMFERSEEVSAREFERAIASVARGF